MAGEVLRAVGISGMIGSGTAYLTASQIARSAAPGQTATDAADASMSDGQIVFNQTINAPEQLSTGEIYRQTRNQLSTVKGVLKNVNQGPTS